MEKGYVKLYRAVDDNELLANDNTCYVVFGKLLTHADRFNGSYKTGRFKLAALCNLKPTTLYAALKRLESSTMIRQVSDNRMTTIYICNWAKYQQDSDSAMTSRRRANDTKQEREKEREVNIRKPSKLLTLLNTVTNRNFRVLPKSANQTEKQFSLEEIETALNKLVKDDWHKGKVSTLSSEYLLRSSTIDKFLSAKDEKYEYLKKHNLTKPNIDASLLKLTRKQLAEREYA